MSYTIIYPDSGADPRLMRESLSDIGVRISAIGSLEPCDPTDMEMDSLAWYLEHRKQRVPTGTVVRLSARTFACVRESVIAYYHLS